MIFVNKGGTKILGGMLPSAGGLLLASRAEVDSPYWSFIVVCMVLRAAAMGLAIPSATDAILAVPPGKSGVCSAVCLWRATLRSVDNYALTGCRKIVLSRAGSVLRASER